MATKTYTSNNKEGRQLRLYLEQTQNAANNTSTIKWTLYSEGGTSNFYDVWGVNIKINGSQVYSCGECHYVKGGNNNYFPLAKGSKSGSVTVTHGSDGKLTIPIYFYTAIYTSDALKNYGGNWTLDANPVKATLSAAPNFTDEDNPTITYYNGAQNLVTSLQAAITTTDNKILANYRDIPKTDTSYTFNLTDAERTTLRNTIPNVQSTTVKIIVRTIINGNTYYSVLEKTFSIKNGEPTVRASLVDTNETTIALTGDKNILIKGYSNAAYKITATAKKGASISKYYAITGGSKYYTSSGTFNNTTGTSYTFGVDDSRGYYNSVTLTKTLVNYFKPTTTITATISGNNIGTITVSGYCFKGSFGAQNNALTGSYRYKLKSGSYTDWIPLTLNTGTNTYSSTAEIEGLDYRQTYIFQARIVDSLNTIYSQELEVVSVPIFDWDKDDFNFNVPVSFNHVPMTAFIEDSGVEDGWLYIKYSNGIAEAYKRYTESSISYEQSGSWYRSELSHCNFPYGLFSSTSGFIPVVTVSANSNQGGHPYINTWNNYEYVTMNVSCVNNKQTDITLAVHAIGKWK